MTQNIPYYSSYSTEVYLHDQKVGEILNAFYKTNKG